MITDFAPRFGVAGERLAGWAKEGKVRLRVDVQEGFKNAPAITNRVLRGDNFGKQLIKL